jgi:hypothetical protein
MTLREVEENKLAKADKARLIARSILATVLSEIKSKEAVNA